MLLTYYMWIKAVKTGSIYWAAMCALAYFYMVSVPSSSVEVFLTPRTALDMVTENTWRENGTDALFIHFRLPKLAWFLCEVLLIAWKNLGLWQL